VPWCTSSRGWEAGALWRDDRGVGLRCIEASSQQALGADVWETMTWRGLVPQGKGAVAAALDNMRPEWLMLPRDGDDDCPRVRAAQRAGLGTIVAVPVGDGEDPIGVLELCRRAPIERDDEHLEVLEAIALQLGQHVMLLERANQPRWSMFTR
jgi:GAF domain-containing protein